MRARHVTILVVLSLVIAALTLIQDVRFDLSLARGRVAALAIEHDVAAVETSLAAWRAAQAGYVATGQGPSFWVKRAAERSTEIEATIVRLHSNTASTTAKAQYDLATSALGALNDIDGRARDFATKSCTSSSSSSWFNRAGSMLGRNAASWGSTTNRDRA